MNNEKVRDSFVFYRSFFQSTKRLTKEDKAELFEAICSYALDGESIEMSAVPDAIFSVIKPQLDGVYKNIEKGEAHWNWKGGITGENYRIRQSSRMKEWRYLVFKRDKFVCQTPNCFEAKDLHAHHIKEFAKYPELRFEVSNGVTVCKSCHNKIHSKRGKNGS